MYMMNITAETAKYHYEGVMQIGKIFAKAVKTFWKENHAAILSNLIHINGNAAYIR